MTYGKIIIALALTLSACNAESTAQTVADTQPVVVVTKGEVFTCTPVSVYDGDGPVWCAEGPRLRLAGIAAREMNETCRANQPCPKASAVAARDKLVEILGGAKGKRRSNIIVSGAPMQCVSSGNAVGTRTGAWCTLADGRDLSCEMVKSGTVLVWDRYWKDHRCPS